MVCSKVCEFMKEIPDISKWNISNVKNMENLFWGCYSLVSLPDISKWNIKNVTLKKGMFCGCKSLTSLPDISKWEMNNIEKVTMFQGCSSLNKNI